MDVEWSAGRLLGTVLALLVPVSASTHEVGQSRYDYTRHVRPVFERRCASCHRSGGVAPMSLLRYEEAAPWARAIRLMVLERRMPPWLPEEGIGSWRGARGLSAQEVDLLVEWASGGAPRGEGSEEARGPGLSSAAEPGADLVLPALAETVLGAEEAERTECVVFAPRLERDRAIVAVELRPGNPEVVRGAVVYHGDACREEDRPLATWLPGDGQFDLPEGASEVLRRGASLAARIHYRKTWILDGKPARDRSRLALQFARGRTVGLEHRNLEAGASTILEKAVRLVAVFPRGARGASLRLESTRPGKDREPLLAIERFDPDWRAKYVLSPPLDLEAGTRLEAVQGGFWIDSLSSPR